MVQRHTPVFVPGVYIGILHQQYQHAVHLFWDRKNQGYCSHTQRLGKLGGGIWARRTLVMIACLTSSRWQARCSAVDSLKSPALMSALLSSSIFTKSECPALAATCRAVNPLAFREDTVAALGSFCALARSAKHLSHSQSGWQSTSISPDCGLCLQMYRTR